MNNILSTTYRLGHLSLVLIGCVLFIWSIDLWHQSTSMEMILLPIVISTACYDNMILSVGNIMGEGNLLKSFSIARFFVHYLVVPLLIVINVELAHRALIVWASNPSVKVLAWALALGLVGLEIVTHFVGLQLIPVRFAGVLRYTIAQPTSLPIVTILVNLFILLTGICIWCQIKCSWLFVGALISLFGNAVPKPIVGSLPSSTSELILILSLVLTQQHTEFTI
jgi:hypothetical protein